MRKSQMMDNSGNRIRNETISKNHEITASPAMMATTTPLTTGVATVAASALSQPSYTNNSDSVGGNGNNGSPDDRDVCTMRTTAMATAAGQHQQTRTTKQIIQHSNERNSQ